MSFKVDPIEALSEAIPGSPGNNITLLSSYVIFFSSFFFTLAWISVKYFTLVGEDYPIYATPPETSFGCDGYIEGYYADPEAECQAFHICANFGDANLVKYSFLCPNGTLFNQQYFICDWWFNVDCSQVLVLQKYPHSMINMIFRRRTSTR